MDGSRAQAGQALGPQCPSAGRGKRSLLAHRREDRAAVEREVRDHARHRHAVAARYRATVRRCDGPPAEAPISVAVAGQRDKMVTEGTGSSASACPAQTTRGTRACTGDPESTPTRPCPMSTGTYSTKGSFIGKDLRRRRVREAETTAFREQNPSHDLIGVATLGPLSDAPRAKNIRLPTAQTGRRHRWIRGDGSWQVGCCRSFGPGRAGSGIHCPRFRAGTLRQPAAGLVPRRSRHAPARMDRFRTPGCGRWRCSRFCCCHRLAPSSCSCSRRRCAAETAPRRHRKRCGPRPRKRR